MSEPYGGINWLQVVVSGLVGYFLRSFGTLTDGWRLLCMNAGWVPMPRILAEKDGPGSVLRLWKVWVELPKRRWVGQTDVSKCEAYVRFSWAPDRQWEGDVGDVPLMWPVEGGLEASATLSPGQRRDVDVICRITNPENAPPLYRWLPPYTARFMSRSLMLGTIPPEEPLPEGEHEIAVILRVANREVDRAVFRVRVPAAGEPNDRFEMGRL